MTCPVKQICLLDALVHDEYGVWGGLSRDERQTIFPTLGVKAVRQAIDEGWFEPSRLPERSEIHDIVRDYRNQMESQKKVSDHPDGLPQVQPVVPFFDFEIQDAQPMEEVSSAHLEKQLVEVPLPIVAPVLNEEDSNVFRFDFETQPDDSGQSSTLQLCN
jgi:hypothetical protein